MKSFMDNPMLVEEVLSIYKIPLQQGLLSHLNIRHIVIPELSSRADTRLSVATIFYMIDGAIPVLQSKTYFPALNKESIIECCKTAMTYFPVVNAPMVFRSIIDRLDDVSKQITGMEALSSTPCARFKKDILDIFSDVRSYYVENLEASVGHAIYNTSSDNSAIIVANTCLSTLVPNLNIEPDDDLRQLVFMDIFDENGIKFVNGVGDAVGKMIVSMTDKSTNNILEGASVTDKTVQEQVMNYLVEVRCVVSNIASTVELCEKTNYDMECDLYKNITASEDCFGDVNPSKFGWTDTDIIANGTINNGIPVNPDNKTKDILSQPQITGKNVQFILGSVALEKDDDKRKAIVEKLKNSLCETLRWETTHENYSDLPVFHFTKRTGQVLESLTKNTAYESRVHEAVEALNEAMVSMVEEEGIPCTFNACPANVLTLAPFPVGVRVSQQLVNNIWRAETDEEMDEAMIEFAKCYNPGNIVAETKTWHDRKVPKTVKLYHGSSKQGLNYIEPRQETFNSDVGDRDLVYASDDPRFCACFGIKWNDDIARQGSWDNWNTVTFGVSDEVDLDKPCSMYELENDGSFTQIKKKEFITDHKIKVKREIKYNTGREMLEAYGVEIITLLDYKKRLNVMEADTVGSTITESNAVSKKAREISRKSQNKTEKNIRNVGGTIHEVKQAVHNAVDPMEKYIGQMLEKAKKEDSARRREILIKGGVAPKVLRWIKRSIPLIAGAAASTVVPVAGVISGISLIGLIASDKMLDEREKRKLMRELEDEIQICNEKIDDSRGDNNKQKKYELIRIRNNLKRTQDRIKYNLKE